MARFRGSLVLVPLPLSLLLVAMYLACTPQPSALSDGNASSSSISASAAPFESPKDRLLASLLKAEMLGVDHRLRNDQLVDLHPAGAGAALDTTLNGPRGTFAMRFMPTARHLGLLMLCVWLT